MVLVAIAIILSENVWLKFQRRTHFLIG